jgi:hypothetical protein
MNLVPSRSPEKSATISRFFRLFLRASLFVLLVYFHAQVSSGFHGSFDVSGIRWFATGHLSKQHNGAKKNQIIFLHIFALVIPGERSSRLWLARKLSRSLVLGLAGSSLAVALAASVGEGLTGRDALWRTH